MARLTAVDLGPCPYDKFPSATAGSCMRLVADVKAGVVTMYTEFEEVQRVHFSDVELVRGYLHRWQKPFSRHSNFCRRAHRRLRSASSRLVG